MALKRGNVVTVVLSGDYGKPRPALIIQSDLFSETASVTVLPLTSTLIDAPLFRIEIEPTEENGLTIISHLMIDKIYTTSREKVGKVIGHLDSKVLLAVERAITVFLGFA